MVPGPSSGRVSAAKGTQRRSGQPKKNFSQNFAATRASLGHRSRVRSQKSLSSPPPSGTCRSKDCLTRQMHRLDRNPRSLRNPSASSLSQQAETLDPCRDSENMIDRGRRDENRAPLARGALRLVVKLCCLFALHGGVSGSVSDAKRPQPDNPLAG